MSHMCQNRLMAAGGAGKILGNIVAATRPRLNGVGLSHAPLLQTTGFTGADLANLVNEAALLAGRGNKGALSSVFCCQKDELGGWLACQGPEFLEDRACARDRATTCGC